MVKSRRHRKGQRKASRKVHRKSHRKTHRRMRGGFAAPVGYSNPLPMGQSLQQGIEFAKYHEKQHGGSSLAMGPYPGAVTAGAFGGEIAAAHQLPLKASYEYISQFGPEADLKGGARRRRKTSRKDRKASRKQRGGLYRWGGGARKYRGGAYAEMRFPMPVSDEGKMLIPEGLRQQAGLNPEWKLAENPMAFAPKM